MDFLQFLLEWVRSLGLDEFKLHWVEFTIASAGLVGSMGIIGSILGWFQFKKRTFFDQMVIGVNVLEPAAGGRYLLKLRTLVENNLDALLDNQILQRMVEKAAKKCTKEWPILELKNTSDHALLLTKIQNAISSRFAKEFVLHLLGQPIETRWLDFVVTCERYGGLKATKIRVLVFIKDDIDRLVDAAFFGSIDTEEPHHSDRLRTLLLIAKTPLAGKDIVHGRVEIPVALGHCAARV